MDRTDKPGGEGVPRMSWAHVKDHAPTSGRFCKADDVAKLEAKLRVSHFMEQQRYLGEKRRDEKIAKLEADLAEARAEADKANDWGAAQYQLHLEMKTENAALREELAAAGAAVGLAQAERDALRELVRTLWNSNGAQRDGADSQEARAYYQGRIDTCETIAKRSGFDLIERASAEEKSDE